MVVVYRISQVRFSYKNNVPSCFARLHSRINERFHSFRPFEKRKPEFHLLHYERGENVLSTTNESATIVFRTFVLGSQFLAQLPDITGNTDHIDFKSMFHI